jgi:PLP dependent protein
MLQGGVITDLPMDIKENIKRISAAIPGGVKLVVVSKSRSIEEIMEVYSAGHKILGENKVQELVEKREDLPDDIEWHFIGHLQSNKVKYIAPFVSLVHSVDSIKLLKTVNKEANKNNRVIDCLLQVHIAMEESKFGFSNKEILEMAESFTPENYPGVRIRGVMGMATFTGDEELIRSEFRQLANLFNKLRESNLGNSAFFNELSMGMSGDYHIALEEGSTIVRIGSLIFGERDYF